MRTGRGKQRVESEGADAGGMLPVALDTLAPASSLDFDLYVRSESGVPVLFRGRTYPLEPEDIRRLMQGNGNTLYIRVSDHEGYCDYLRTVVLDNPELPPGQRINVLTAVNRSVFENAFSSSNVNRYVDFARGFGQQLTDTICGSDVAVGDLCRLLRHDYYTFTHVANVTVYCMALANALGYRDRDTLQQIAVGGLLHDYGKRFVSAYTLNYTGRLSAGQFREIRRHPHDGFCQFALRADVQWGQLMMIYQHHERPDGKGYPVGVTAAEIHPWARICKVADVFDALTSARPYRRADAPKAVLAFMAGKVGTEFDEDVLACFQAMIN